jgi:hypothetical protein
MAITRCPYCHAIIDESDKYCNNCGTQLLFPEDETVEEEIKGEKIIDAETEDKDYDTGEPREDAAGDLEEEPEAADLLEDVEEEETKEEKTGEFTSDLAGESGDAESDRRFDEEGAGGEEPREEEREERTEEEEGQAGAEKDRTEEVILVDEIEAQEKEPGKVATGEEASPAAPEPGPGASSAGEEIGGFPEAPEEGRDGGEEAIEYIAPPAAADDVEKPKAASEGVAAKDQKPDTEEVRTGEIESVDEEPSAAQPSPVPMTFDTHELEGIGKTIELSKDRLDTLLEVMADKEEASVTPPAPSEARPDTPTPAGPEKKTGTLPPWADRMRGATLFPGREDTRDAGRRFIKEPAGAAAGGWKEDETGEAESGPSLIEAEEELFPRCKPSDSGIGLPERLSQAALPFGPGAAGPDESEEAEEGERPLEAAAAAPRPFKIDAARPRAVAGERGEPAFEAEPEIEEGRAPFQVSVFLKAKAFDVLFVGIFWLVALWVAARSMGATLFELLSVTSQPVLFLYVIFILIYFFLFKFFLGETLGDRLFKERD